MNNAVPAAQIANHGSFRGRIYENALETIGATPLVRLASRAQRHGCAADVLGKCEFFNPLG